MKLREFTRAFKALAAKYVRVGSTARDAGLLLRYALHRRTEQLRYELAKVHQAYDPNVHVYCVTTPHEGCRVVVKRLGGWS